MSVTNVIKMPVRPETSAKAVTLAVPLGDLESTRAALDQIEVAAQLACDVLDKSDEYGHEAAVDGVRQIFCALAALLAPGLMAAVLYVSQCVDADGVCNLIL